MAYMPDGEVPEHLDVIFDEFSTLSKEAIAENKVLYLKYLNLYYQYEQFSRYYFCS